MHYIMHHLTQPSYFLKTFGKERMIGLKNRKLSEKDSSLSDQEPEQSEAETSVDGRVYTIGTHSCFKCSQVIIMKSSDATKKKKEPTSLKKILTRTATAVVLILLYLCLIMSGHLYCIIAMVITQVSTGTIISLVIILNS